MGLASDPAHRCPLCHGDNACRVSHGHLYKGPCWCHEIVVPRNVLTLLAEEAGALLCLCRPCLETLARVAQELDDPSMVLTQARRMLAARTTCDPGARNAQETETAAEPEYYLDEFGNTVFTAAYHLKRGNCCGNQCRHCPY